MAKAKRLSKVAREFNIGINTIIEFLSEKGYDVDAKPNTKIEPEIYEVLVDEFQSEKSAKEESKQVSIGGKTEEKAVSIEEVDKDEDKSKDSDEEVLIKNVQTGAAADISDADDEEEGKKEEKEEEAKTEDEEEDEEVKVVGKIDLDSMNMKTRPDSKKKKDEAKKKEEEDKEEKEKAETKKKEEEDKKKEKEDEAKSKEKEGDKPRDEDIKVDVEKLDGPKVVGKIDLPEKKKPVASSSDDASDRKKKKRKRKRIRKKSEAVDPKSASKKGKRRKHKKDDKPEVTEEEIQKEIKETLARLTGGGKSKSAKYRRQKREEQKQQQQEEQEKLEEQQKMLTVAEFVTANELANMMDVDVNEVIAACMDLGMFVSINQRLDAETITIVAEEFGYDVEFVSAEEKVDVVEKEDKPEDLQSRPPVVTVMGHVDHGKTSLLDHIRQANVIAGEAGGITQHIGAYNVALPDKRTITFLDTPGHEAFTAMRARGAQVTDVAIIIIAADDNVMPQTKEAINHAQAAGVPIVFAINKIDKPNANPEKVKEELSQMNILVEDWGGKYQCQEISAKKGTNVDELLEKVLLEAELLDVKANPDKNANGTVIESMLDKGRGYVATLLVQAGTMKVGDVVLAGCFSGRVKAMFNERGQKINEAGPSIPVSMLGLDGAPTAGDKFNVMDDEREAREIADRRTQLQREQGVRTQKHITLDEIGRRIAVGDFQELNIIVKGDVDGSIEALSDSLLKLSTGQIQVNIIHKSVGQITESDVMLAAASDAIIVGFQVRPSVTARKVAEREQIDIRLYSIIYDAVEEIKSAMEGMLAPKVEENVVATLEVRETFKISKVGTIAGCMVQDGKINRNNKVRLIREGIVVYDGELGSLKRFKDDVKEVASGYECGLNIENYNDIKVGDVIEAYEEVEVKQTLE